MLFESWGATPAERALHLACDDLVSDAHHVLHRAVPAEAPVPVLFRWLCQLRAAPYSYDLVDNLGRRSPQALTPGLDQLELGQRAAGVFRIAAFDDTTLTLLAEHPLAGRTAMTYAALPGRLYGRLAIHYPRFSPLRIALPAGDLVMMRRQLLNLASLAARSSEPG